MDYGEDPSFPLGDGRVLTASQLHEIAAQRWGFKDIEIHIEGFWYNLDDIEFGPEITFRSAELLGENGYISITDYFQDSQPVAYNGRFLIRLEEGEFPFERCLEFTSHRDGRLLNAGTSPHLVYACRNNQPITLDELVTICWAIHLAAGWLKGQAVCNTLAWGTGASKPEDVEGKED